MARKIQDRLNYNDVVLENTKMKNKKKIKKKKRRKRQIRIN